MVMVLGFFARLGNVLVSIVVGVPGTLIFVVLFVIVGEVVLPGGRLSFTDLGSIFSQPLVGEELLLHIIDGHISHGREILLGNNSACMIAPVSLDSLHVPLIDNGHDVLVIFEVVVEILKNTNIPLVDNDILLLRGRPVEERHEEINTETVH